MTLVDSSWRSRVPGILGALLRALVYFWIALSIVVLVIFGTIRVVETFEPPDPRDSFGVRYVLHPVVSLAHYLPGLAFLLLAPVQFSSTIRRRFIGWHRGSGRVLVVLAAVSGVYALAAAFVLPAFGGLPTLLATLLFAPLFLYSLWRAVSAIRRRRVAEHREWMIRVFALGLGVATIRALVPVAEGLTGGSMEEVFGLCFWLGLVINATVAEVWIRSTRRRSS